jgi:hypothetical protein
VKAADGRHLRDDQMIAVYIDAEPRFGRRDRKLSHLQWCARCAQRYQQFVEQLTDAREDAAAEADAMFTPARLEAQRLQILHRLEHASHPAARVIPFPSHGGQNLSIFTGSQVRRWIAAAAAAGLLIGLTVGRMTDFRTAPQGRVVTLTAPAPAPPPEAPRPAVDTRPNEEEILSRAEQAQGMLQVPAELEALGAITPIREVALTLPPRR